MCRSRYVLPALFICLVLIGFMALAKDKDPAPASSSSVTVGDFAMEVVKMADDNPANLASLTPEKAMARLGKAGLRFQGGSGAVLTEGEKSSFFLAMANGLLEKIAPPPDGFDTCLDRSTVGECRACCLSLPNGSERLCGRACGQAHANQQRPSPSEPTP